MPRWGRVQTARDCPCRNRPALLLSVPSRRLRLPVPGCRDPRIQGLYGYGIPRRLSHEHSGKEKEAFLGLTSVLPHGSPKPHQRLIFVSCVSWKGWGQWC